MPDELLPPDPSKDGWYWLNFGRNMAPVMFSAADRMWNRHPGGQKVSPERFAEFGCRLASPHPIPTPEQLDALHDLENRLSLAQRLTLDGRVIVSVVLRDIRAALGAKPSPNDDIRAVAIDGCAGKETAP